MTITPLTDAWRTLVPDLDDRHGPLPPLMVALTVVTGLVDAFSYLALNHVFVANMTGNVVFIAFAVGGSPGFSITASATALVAFVVGAMLGGRFGHRSVHRGRNLVTVIGVQALLLLAAFLLALLVPRTLAGVGKLVLIILVGSGMGAQNALARRLAVPDLTTTVLTLTLTGMGADGRLAGGADSKVGRRLLSALSMFLGALVGALLVMHSNPAWALLCALLILAAVVGVGIRLARSSRPWTVPT